MDELEELENKNSSEIEQSQECGNMWLPLILLLFCFCQSKPDKNENGLKELLKKLDIENSHFREQPE